MDPLSISTVVVTLLGACAGLSKILDKARKVRDVPEVLLALNNEVSDLRLTLMDIHDRREEFLKKDYSSLNEEEKRLLEACHTVLERTWNKVHEAEWLLRNGLQRIEAGKKFNIRFWLNSRENETLVRLQVDVRDAKQSMQGIWNQLNLRQSQQIQAQLSGILGTSNDIQDYIFESVPALSGDHSRIERKLDQLLELQRALSSPPPILAIDTSANASKSASNRHRVEISLQRIQTLSKSAGHPCTCQRRRGSYSFVHRLLGCLLLGYVAAPNMSHELGCRHNFQANIVLVYSFPAWFLHYTLALCAQYDARVGVKYSLSIRQVVSVDHIVWALINDGDVEGLNGLISSGQISLEVRGFNGNGLLPQAILSGNLEVVTFLLRSGVKRDSEYSYKGGCTGYQLAWDGIFAGNQSTEWKAQMKMLFPDPDFEELYEFSALHRSVIGIEDEPVDQVVYAYPSIVDQKDSLGRTPLMWAAYRGEIEKLEILLSLQAKVDLEDNIGQTALSYAIIGKRWTCIEALLRVAAIKNPVGTSLLHILAESDATSSHDLQIIQTLLDARLRVNETNALGRTVLRCAAYWATPELVEYLIDHGANLCLRSYSGPNALSDALKGNRSDNMKVLLEHGADHNSSLPDFGTFLHLVAARADSENLRVLLDYRLKPRDINVKNKEGLTPLQVGFRRENINAEWRDLFVQFLKSVDQDSVSTYPDPLPARTPSAKLKSACGVGNRSTSGQTTDHASHSDDEFEDAVEVIEVSGARVQQSEGARKRAVEATGEDSQ